MEPQETLQGVEDRGNAVKGDRILRKRNISSIPIHPKFKLEDLVLLAVLDTKPRKFKLIQSSLDLSG